jgi:hypothetical protein
MIVARNESWLLTFEEKIDIFIKRYRTNKVYLDYKKYYKEYGYKSFYNKTFGLRSWSVANNDSTTKK